LFETTSEWIPQFFSEWIPLPFGTDQYLESFLHILREGWHQQVTSHKQSETLQQNAGGWWNILDPKGIPGGF